MIPALTILLCLQLVGEIASRGLSLPLPGPVVGLVLLVVICVIRPSVADRLRAVTQTILGHLSLFFVPAGVGVIAHFSTIAEHGIGLGLALAVSTILAIAAAAVTFSTVARLIGSNDD